MKDQSQDAGDNSTNVQAGRDATIINNGLDRAEAMEVFRTIAKWEIEHYHDLAWQKVTARLDEFRAHLIERIEKLEPRRLDSFSDPDVQMCISDAQRSYARSGREDVRRVLVDLIADRCKAESDSLQAVVVTSAIEVTRRLSRGAIAALTVNFLVMKARGVGLNSVDQVVSWLHFNLGPLVSYLPRQESEYSLLAGTGAAEIGSFRLATDENDIRKRLFATYGDAFPEGTTEDAAFVEIAARFSQWNVLEDAWNTTHLRYVSVTSIGIAIAHADWSNRTGGDADLSIWIPEK